MEVTKEGFKIFGNKSDVAILNLSNIQLLLKNKKFDIKNTLDIKFLKEKNLIKKKYKKLKILGKGEIKEKLSIKTDFISKSAKSKIEKVGGTINLVKKTV